MLFFRSTYSHYHLTPPKFDHYVNVRINVDFYIKMVVGVGNCRNLVKKARKSRKFSNIYRKFREVTQNRGFDSPKWQIFSKKFLVVFSPLTPPRFLSSSFYCNKKVKSTVFVKFKGIWSNFVDLLYNMHTVRKLKTQFFSEIWNYNAKTYSSAKFQFQIRITSNNDPPSHYFRPLCAGKLFIRSQNDYNFPFVSRR